MQVSFDNEDSVKISIHGFCENEMKLLENKYNQLRKHDEPDWLAIKLINNIEVTFFRAMWEEKEK
jgi:hypothetical protein